MATVRRTFLEALGLLVFAALIAFSANQLRGSGRIKPGKNYFDRGMTAGLVPPVDLQPDHDDPQQPPPGDLGSEPPKPSSTAVTAPIVKHADHPFQRATIDDVKEAFNDPGREAGINVFVDARSDDTFEAGHIPGAIVCNPYEVENYIDRVLSSLGNAEKIFVYCGGGDCEDSIFLCRELVTNYNVAFNKLFLFEGGWKEWTQHNMPTQTGLGE